MDLTLRHAEALIDHYGHRLRRRIAGPALLEAAKTIADCLFLKLPESRGELSDAATEHKHSFAHHIWPRADEMGYQERLAQYRAAWQRLEMAVTDLRREQPDPVLAHETCARRPPPTPPSSPTWSRAAWPRASSRPTPRWWPSAWPRPTRTWASSTAAWARLRRSLAEQLEAARSLVQGRVELTNSQMAAAVGSHAAEIIQLREQARLEAMAFEI